MGLQTLPLATKRNESSTRPRVLRCRHCRNEVSLTGRTIMHATRTPLQAWFWGAYLVTTQTLGLSALQFQRATESHRYETAFQLLHKRRVDMVRPDRDRIGGERLVEVDETLFGGRTRGEGRSVHQRKYGVGAVEFRAKLDKPRRRSVYAGPSGCRPWTIRPRRRWRRSSRRTRSPTVMFYHRWMAGLRQLGNTRMRPRARRAWWRPLKSGAGATLDPPVFLERGGLGLTTA